MKCIITITITEEDSAAYRSIVDIQYYGRPQEGERARIGARPLGKNYVPSVRDLFSPCGRLFPLSRDFFLVM